MPEAGSRRLPETAAVWRIYRLTIEVADCRRREQWRTVPPRTVPPIMLLLSDEKGSLLCRVSPDGSSGELWPSQRAHRSLSTDGHRRDFERGPRRGSTRELRRMGLNHKSERTSQGRSSTALAHECCAARRDSMQPSPTVACGLLSQALGSPCRSAEHPAEILNRAAPALAADLQTLEHRSQLRWNCTAFSMRICRPVQSKSCK